MMLVLFVNVSTLHTFHTQVPLLVYCIIIIIVPCNNGDIRLGDENILKGRVEVCINGTWGTICDNYWTDNEASVVCSQLEYSPYGEHLLLL